MAELARGLLLKRRGRGWRRRMAPALLAVDRSNVQESLRGFVDRAFDVARRSFVRGAELLDLLAVELDELQLKGLRGVLAHGFERPVFLRHELRHLFFA